MSIKLVSGLALRFDSGNILGFKPPHWLHPALHESWDVAVTNAWGYEVHYGEEDLERLYGRTPTEEEEKEFTKKMYLRAIDYLKKGARTVYNIFDIPSMTRDVRFTKGRRMDAVERYLYDSMKDPTVLQVVEKFQRLEHLLERAIELVADMPQQKKLVTALKEQYEYSALIKAITAVHPYPDKFPGADIPGDSQALMGLLRRDIEALLVIPPPELWSSEYHGYDFTVMATRIVYALLEAFLHEQFNLPKRDLGRKGPETPEEKRTRERAQARKKEKEARKAEEKPEVVSEVAPPVKTPTELL